MKYEVKKKPPANIRTLFEDLQFLSQQLYQTLLIRSTSIVPSVWVVGTYVVDKGSDNDAL